MNICWLSAGVSSFIGAYLCKDELDKAIYIHIDDQEPDTLRFIKDCEKALRMEIEIIQSKDFKTVEEVCRKYKYINGVYGAKCTMILKKKVREIWEQENLTEKPTYCGDPIKLDQIPERIYIFSGIFYAAFFSLYSIGLKYPNFSFILSLL